MKSRFLSLSLISIGSASKDRSLDLFRENSCSITSFMNLPIPLRVHHEYGGAGRESGPSLSLRPSFCPTRPGRVHGTSGRKPYIRQMLTRYTAVADCRTPPFTAALFFIFGTLYSRRVRSSNPSPTVSFIFDKYRSTVRHTTCAITPSFTLYFFLLHSLQAFSSPLNKTRSPFFSICQTLCGRWTTW